MDCNKNSWKKIKKEIRTKNIWISFIIVGIFFGILFSHADASQEQEEKIIRVAFPIQAGITEVNEDGSYSGYTYDYLKEIAQYTNWKYEFVQVEGDLNTQISTLLDMLIKGEVDLMGGMVLNQELTSIMDYAGYNYGTSYSTLCTLNENTEINSSNYISFKKLRVAVLKTSKTYIKKLEQFAEMNGIEIEKIPCETEEEQIDMIKKGKADVLFCVDINMPDKDLRIVTRFAPEAFYFAATKGRTDIITELNFAISSINEANPHFMTSLHEKYFSLNSKELYLSEEERKYIAQNRELKVLMFGEKAPIQYKEDKTNEIKGISKDILDDISNKTGLQFDILYVNSIEEYNHMMEEENIALIAGIINESDNILYHENYTSSIPYMEVPTVMALNKNINPSELENKYQIICDETNQEKAEKNKLYFNTIEECLHALNQGRGDYFYGNSYMIQYYIKDLDLKNIITLPETEICLQKVAFGIVKPVNQSLLSIINKSIQSLSESELRDFLYENAFQTKGFTLLSYIKANPEQIIFGIIILIMIGISSFLACYAYNYKKSDERRRIENLRYEQIGDLAKEYIFEYDILKDILKMPEKCAQFLETQKIIENIKKKKGKMADEIRYNQEFFDYIISAQEGNKELNFQFLDGKSHWIKIISKLIVDKNNIPIICIGKIVDIQQEKEKQNQLLEEAKKDSLTDIYNAATTHEMITESLSEEIGALFIIDIDYFKKVNDNYGHYNGDYVLKELANILKESFRKGDIIGRLGGDEFLIFMKGISDKKIIEGKCKLICRKVKEISINDEKEKISVSIGVNVTENEKDYSEVYKKADKALYVVKKRGRNGYEINQ